MLSPHQGEVRGIQRSHLKKHFLIWGMPGSGKSMVLLWLMYSFYAASIPFIFFIPIRGEQVLLKMHATHHDPVLSNLAKELRVYTPGKPDISPLCFNPLERWGGRPLFEHIEGLMDCFTSTIVNYPPMVSCLREALYSLYAKHPHIDNPPLMSDLMKAVEKEIQRKGYQGELLSNLRAAADVRLSLLCRGPLEMVFRTGRTLPSLQDLTSKYTIIELAGLSDEQAAIFNLFFAQSILDYIISTASGDGDPRLILGVDELHRLAGTHNDRSQSSDLIDPKANASRLFCKMMAEMRKNRMGFIGADQSRHQVASELSRMAGAQLALRTTDPSDRKDLSDSMLFTEYEYEETVRLSPGEGFLFTEGLHRPRKIRLVNIQELADFSTPPTDAELVNQFQKESWVHEERDKRRTAELDRFEQSIRSLTGTAKEINDRIRMLKIQVQDVDPGSREITTIQLVTIRDEFRKCYETLRMALEEFEKNVYRNYVEMRCSTDSTRIQNRASELQRRYSVFIKEPIKKEILSLQEIINMFDNIIRK